MRETVVIIGSVALGPKAACRFKRLKPDAKVVMVDQDELISYGACGIPYLVSGDVSDADQLLSTSFHMLRDAAFFRDTKDIEVLTRTRALSIDRTRKTVLVESLSTGCRESLPYDRLVLATGSRPRPVPVPGADLPGVVQIAGLHDAVAVKEQLTAGELERVVVIGAGPVGLEMAAAFADLWGVETCVIEIEDQILPGLLSANLARMARHHMEEHGITFLLREKVVSLDGDGRVRRVVTEKREVAADLVVTAVGVTPEARLAQETGLDISPSGAVQVNRYLQTSDPDIYAGGDVVETPNLITGKPGYWPQGSLANRQGRVIGTNLAGGREIFEGAVGSFAVKLFEICVAGAGLSRKVAQEEGFDALSAFVAQFDRAHFYPEKDLMYLELVFAREDGRVLGIQGLAPNGDALLARIAPVAALLKDAPTTRDISNLELPYSPPFSAAMDILNALGNTAENLLAGRTRVIDPVEFVRWWENGDPADMLCLDCREWGNAGSFVEKYPAHWKNIPQGQLRQRLHEVPPDKRLVLICNTGVRSYEAQITLEQFGLRNSVNVQGGMAAIKMTGLDL